MSEPTDVSSDERGSGPPVGGSSFLPSGYLRRVWRCPFCAEAIAFPIRRGDIGDRLVNAHIREHRVKGMRVRFERPVAPTDGSP